MERQGRLAKPRGDGLEKTHRGAGLPLAGGSDVHGRQASASGPLWQAPTDFLS